MKKFVSLVISLALVLVSLVVGCHASAQLSDAKAPVVSAASASASASAAPVSSSAQPVTPMAAAPAVAYFAPARKHTVVNNTPWAYAIVGAMPDPVYGMGYLTTQINGAATMVVPPKDKVHTILPHATCLRACDVIYVPLEFTGTSFVPMEGTRRITHVIADQPNGSTQYL